MYSGSRGSVILIFASCRKGRNYVAITDYRMTRFWITLDEGIDLVLKALDGAIGGETYIAKIPSFKITDLALAICPNCKICEVGAREGEKLHEVMITKEDSFSTYEFDKHYVVYPHMDWFNIQKYDLKGARKVKDRFEYSSGTNSQWLNIEDLKLRLKQI
jgi:FlaA1/EpsC-like NDP-sugar epimerase